MKNNHVLIDYENVQPEVAKTLALPIFKVWVFLGVQQVKVKVDLLELVQNKGEDARIIRMTTSGRNALDFQIACYLGKLWTEDPEAYFHVIAADSGLDPLLDHLRGQGVNAARWVNVRDIPIVKVPAAESEDVKLSRVIEYLVRRGRSDRGRTRPLLDQSLLCSALSSPKPMLRPWPTNCEAMVCTRPSAASSSTDCQTEREATSAPLVAGRRLEDFPVSALESAASAVMPGPKASQTTANI